jgi:replicative DNA helicase
MAAKHQHSGDDATFGNLPPQSIEAEASLLSAILLDSDTFLEVIEVLSADDFYKPRHQLIFDAITTLFERNEPIDIVTVTDFLRDRSKLEAIGGATFLASLVDTVPVAGHAQHYGKIVRGKARLRRLIQKANEIIKQCYANPGDVAEVVDFAEAAVFEVSDDEMRSGLQPLSRVLDKNFDLIDARAKDKSPITGVATGFGRLDNLTSGLQPSDLIILAARPAMGKTAFALNLARNAAELSGKPVAVFSLEMSIEQLSLRMLCAEARVNAKNVRSGYISAEDNVKLVEAADRLAPLPIFIDDSPDISTTEIRAKSRRIKMDKDLGLVIIDYLQLMRTRRQAERRDLEISEISRGLKIMAKELSVPVVALSQLNRKLEERSDKRPQLADLRESGALEQDADVVAFIYRDEVYHKDREDNQNLAELIISKQRSGPVGKIPLTFLKEYTRFESAAEGNFPAGYQAPPSDLDYL